MNTGHRSLPRLGWAIAVVALLAASAAFGAEPVDPLADEIARWSAYLRDHPAGDENWDQIKSMSGPVLAKAQEALAAGRRELALDRLAVVRANLAAQVYVDRCAPALRTDSSAFEAEWARVGQELGASLAVPSTTVLAGVLPAATRAEAEATLLQIRGFYDASLDYGRATMPDAGLFYMGQALAQRDFVAFCRALPPPRTVRPAALRSIRSEIDALNRELLAAYRPPASIDKHSEFILAHSLVNEARGLDAAGLAYGAYLRYLQAAMRSGALRGVVPVPPDAVPVRTRELEERLSATEVDATIGRLFLEAAQSNAELGPSILADVLPRYFDAVAPAKPEPKKSAPGVTVTLVRWPYT